MIDKDGFEWGERGDPIKKVILYTNRSVMVFNDKGLQIPFYQVAISCYRVNKKIAQEIADKAQGFSIAKWREWVHPISRREFEYLLSLRNKKRDLEDGR